MRGTAIVKSATLRADLTYLVSVEVANDSGREKVEFVLLEELWQSLEIEIGNDINKKLSVIDSYSAITAAYLSACSSFAYVQSSFKALQRKLLGKGFSKEASREAIEIIRRRGFVDEGAIAHCRAELAVEKLWGRSRILAKLYEEGFPTEVIDEVSGYLDEVDFAENCERVINKKYPCLPSERKEHEKMYASLLRFGYSSSDIRKALANIHNNE